MDDQPDQHESLVAELRALCDHADPVPPLVTEAAKAAFGWRRLDADLAELLADSTLDEQSLALARGAGASARAVSFSARELTVEVEIHADGAVRTLLGQLSPPRPATIEVQTPDDNAAATAATDHLGRFRVQVPGGRRIRLRIMSRDLDPVAVETSWIAI